MGRVRRKESNFFFPSKSINPCGSTPPNPNFIKYSHCWKVSSPKHHHIGGQENTNIQDLTPLHILVHLISPTTLPTQQQCNYWKSSHATWGFGEIVMIKIDLTVISLHYKYTLNIHFYRVLSVSIKESSELKGHLYKHFYNNPVINRARSQGGTFTKSLCNLSVKGGAGEKGEGLQYSVMNISSSPFNTTTNGATIAQGSLLLTYSQLSGTYF